MDDTPASRPRPDVRDARNRFPATEHLAYFNTAATGLASRSVADTLHRTVDEWVEHGFDYHVGEAAGEMARRAVAGLIGADPSAVALIPSVSAAAGLVSAQFGPAEPGQNVVVGDREYTSNLFPWRLLARKGYEVRQVPFRNGGVEPEDMAAAIDGGTVLVAFSGVQSASGHRADADAISHVARAVGAVVFVDGTQLVGALPIGDELADIDVLATADHKFLLHAGRGMGYCYFSDRVQERFTPINAGWKAGRDPSATFFGPEMDLSPTASRFDNSISWIAALGNQAALAIFDEFGTDAIYARNRHLEAHLRAALIDVGWHPIDFPAEYRSAIVSVPLGGHSGPETVAELRRRGIAVAARDGNLRLAVHFYNHEDDIARVVAALREIGTPTQ